jgi:hypothetical protein
VNDVGLGEENQAVAVGVPVGDVQDFDLFAVEVDGEGVVEGDDGEGFLGRRPAGEPLADVGVRDDGRLAAEVGVGAGVVAVEMGVEDELELTGIELLEGRLDLGRQRGEFVVDDEQPVGAGGDANVPALALEHVYVAGDVSRLDVHLGEVLLRMGGGAGHQYEGRNQSEIH